MEPLRASASKPSAQRSTGAKKRSDRRGSGEDQVSQPQATAAARRTVESQHADIMRRWVGDAGSGPAPPKASTSVPAPAEEVNEVEEGYGDDFEDYEEDFETDEQSPKFMGHRDPPGKTVVTVVSPTKRPAGATSHGSRPGSATPQPDMKSLQESLRQENSAAIEHALRLPVAEAKAGSGGLSGAPAKGAKGAKGSRIVLDGKGGNADSTPAGGLAAAKVSAGGDAHQRRSASFKMLDPQALGRALAAAGPKGQRAAQLKTAVRLEVVRFTAFRQASATSYTRYMRSLRDAAPRLRQAASQSHEEDRSIEVQTDEIVSADKEVQFHLGHDDTALENMMSQMRHHRRKRDGDSAAGKREAKESEGTEAAAAAPVLGRQQKGSRAGHERVSLRLGRFLQQAGALVEALLEENNEAARAARGNEANELAADGPVALFAGSRPWRELGGGKELSEGLLKVTARCGVAALACFSTRVGLLAAAFVHLSQNGSSATTAASKEDESSSAPLPGRSLVCVWDAGSSDSGAKEPSAGNSIAALAVGEGRFSALATAGSSVVVAGTEEGTLLLWDLSEPRSRHVTAESRRLGLTCGLRRPTYTTAAGGRLQSSGATGLETTHPEHSSAVVSVVVVPTAGESGVGTSSSAFQVASLDDRGLVVIWQAVTEPGVPDEAGSQTDLGLLPGGKIRLVVARTVVVGPLPPPSKAAAARMAAMAAMRSGSGGANDSAPSWDGVINCLREVGPTAITLAFFPHDPGRFVVAATDGNLLHASRIGSEVVPRAYLPSAGFQGPAAGLAAVSCIAVHPRCPHHLLAGDASGTVRLYNQAHARPLTTWLLPPPEAPSSLSEAEAKEEGADVAAHGRRGRRKRGPLLPAAVVSLRWSLRRPAVFVVLDACGSLHAFDLRRNDRRPISTVSAPGGAACFDLAAGGGCSSGSAIAAGSASGHVFWRPLHTALARPVPSKGESTADGLAEEAEWMAHWLAHVVPSM